MTASTATSTPASAMRRAVREQRAVAAEHDDQVDFGRQRVGRRPCDARRCRRRRRSPRRAPASIRARIEPGDQVAHDARPAVEPRLDDDPDAADGRPLHDVSLPGLRRRPDQERTTPGTRGCLRRRRWATAWCRGGRGRAGPPRPRPRRRRARGRPRSRTMPPAPTSSRPASNCGLTSAIEVPRRRQQRHQRRQDEPQRDERDVDGDRCRRRAARPARAGRRSASGR